MKGIIKPSIFAAVACSLTIIAGCSGNDDIKGEDTIDNENTENESDTTIVEMEPDGMGGIVESYITGYFRPSGISMCFEEWLGAIYLDIDCDYLNREQSHVLSERYNDLSYNKVQSVPVHALYDGITSLSMETVDYFDEAHPAGSDVSDIVYCKYLTYYEFITSGYEAIEKDLESYPHMYYVDEEGTKLYEMLLSEVNYDNSQLMTDQMLMEFVTEPEVPGTYEFRFFFNMPEIELSTTFECEFQ